MPLFELPIAAARFGLANLSIWPGLTRRHRIIDEIVDGLDAVCREGDIPVEKFGRLSTRIGLPGLSIEVWPSIPDNLDGTYLYEHARIIVVAGKGALAHEVGHCLDFQTGFSASTDWAETMRNCPIYSARTAAMSIVFPGSNANQPYEQLAYAFERRMADAAPLTCRSTWNQRDNPMMPITRDVAERVRIAFAGLYERAAKVAHLTG